VSEGINGWRDEWTQARPKARQEGQGACFPDILGILNLRCWGPLQVAGVQLSGPACGQECSEQPRNQYSCPRAVPAYTPAVPRTVAEGPPTYVDSTSEKSEWPGRMRSSLQNVHPCPSDALYGSDRHTVPVLCYLLEPQALPPVTTLCLTFIWGASE
jgi:hypothetical protein